MNDTPNDFESRARAAGRAARNAVDDVPAVKALPLRSARGPIRALAIAAAVVLVAVAGTAIAVNQRADGPASDVTSFCAEVSANVAVPTDVVTNEQNGSVKRSSTGASVEYLRDAPPEIRSAALELLRAQESNGAPRPGARQSFLRWYQLRCFPRAAQPGASADQQRFAPPSSAAFTVCNVSNRLPAVDQYNAAHPDNDHMTILGNVSAADPYLEPMIGLAISTTEGFRDDATVRPAPDVNHPDAAISDITGPFGARIGAGLVVSWSDGRRTIGVFGRGYAGQESALITLANRVTLNDQGRPQLAAADMPPDYGVVFDGPLSELNTLGVDPSWTFEIDANQSALRLTGSERDRNTSEAVRFLGTGLHPVSIGGVRFLAGPLIATGQPTDGSLAMVRWTESHGVSLTLTSVTGSARPAPTLDQLEKLAVSTRKLDRSEWETLINQSDGCFGDLVQSRTASGAGSATPPESGPAVTATTSPAVPTSVP